MSNHKLKKLLPRKPDSHKGDFGHVLIIGGDYGMGGAVIMAGEAACRAGAGRVSVLTREENFSALLARLPNVMTVPKAFDSEKILFGKTVIAIGPGLGKSAWSHDLFEMAMSSNLPKVIDADALNLLSESKKKFELANSVITPHVGEASRLLDESVNEIQNNRELAVKKLYQKFGATAVLKGKGSLVFGAKKKIYHCDLGNPGMAVAGMGDVLTGIISGLMAQNLEGESAAIFGVKVHASAGDMVAKKHGEIGIIPSDLFPYISMAINQKNFE